MVMAIFLCFFWLLLLYADSYIRAKDKDLFSPLRFVTLRFMCQELPFILYIAISPGSFLKNLLSVCKVDVQQAFVQFTFVKTVAYLCLTAGMSFFDKEYPFFKRVKRVTADFSVKLSSLRVMYISLFLIGVFTYLFFLYRIGGLAYLLSHIGNKTRLYLFVNKYYLLLLNFFYIAPLLCMKAIKQERKVFDKCFFVVMVIVTVLLQNTMGGRTSTLVFLAVLLAGYNYLVKPIRISKRLFKRGMIAALFFVVYMIAVPFMRTGRKMTDVKDYASVYTYMYQTSYVYIDVFSSNYFTFDNAWWFSGFFAPIEALGAKKDKGDIPQVDQGVYFKSIVLRQQYYKPPIPRKELIASSWPTENFGFAYANLLLPGIVIFYFLQGAFFMLVYRCMKVLNNPGALAFYVIFILFFNFSSLRIADFMKVAWVYFLVIFLYHKFIYRKLTSK